MSVQLRRKIEYTTVEDGQPVRIARTTRHPIDGSAAKSVRPVTRINGQRIYFAELAQLAWPQKTEANLAFITGYDPRTCRRWLADDTEPPAEALAAVLAEIMRRAHQRT